jgi:Tol biopolymer transport system component
MVRACPLIAVVLHLVLPGASQAALPGENGKLVFAASRASSPTDIWISEPDGSQQRNLTATAKAAESDPSAGPAGRLVAYSRRQGGDLDIYVTRADGSGRAVNLTRDSAADDHSPAFGPDGQIAYVSDRTGSDDIFVMSSNGTQRRNLTPRSPAQDTEPSVSGAGGLVAFSSDRDGDSDIYAVGLAGGRAANLTPDAPERDTRPAFSPDGRTIAFFSARHRYDSSVDVWSMAADGSGVELLIDYDEGLSGPIGYSAAFSPEGGQLIAGEDGHGAYPYLAVTDLGAETTRNVMEMGVSLSDPDWAPAK